MSIDIKKFEGATLFLSPMRSPSDNFLKHTIDKITVIVRRIISFIRSREWRNDSYWASEVKKLCSNELKDPKIKPLLDALKQRNFYKPLSDTSPTNENPRGPVTVFFNKPLSKENTRWAESHFELQEVYLKQTYQQLSSDEKKSKREIFYREIFPFLTDFFQEIPYIFTYKNFPILLAKEQERLCVTFSKDSSNPYQVIYKIYVNADGTVEVKFNLDANNKKRALYVTILDEETLDLGEAVQAPFFAKISRTDKNSLNKEIVWNSQIKENSSCSCDLILLLEASSAIMGHILFHQNYIRNVLAKQDSNIFPSFKNLLWDISGCIFDLKESSKQEGDDTKGSVSVNRAGQIENKFIFGPIISPTVAAQCVAFYWEIEKKSDGSFSLSSKFNCPRIPFVKVPKSGITFTWNPHDKEKIECMVERNRSDNTTEDGSNLTTYYSIQYMDDQIMLEPIKTGYSHNSSFVCNESNSVNIQLNEHTQLVAEAVHNLVNLWKAEDSIILLRVYQKWKAFTLQKQLPIECKSLIERLKYTQGIIDFPVWGLAALVREFNNL